MALEILFSAVIILIAGYCYIYVGLSERTTVYTDPLGSTFWPKLLLGLLIIFLVINIIQIYRRTPPEQRNLDSITKINWKSVLRSRLLWGIVLFSAYALLLPTTGFLLTSFVLCIILSRLLGEKRPAVLLIFSFLAVSLVFIIFFRGMSIMLPRGTVPVLRSFALAVEAFLRNLGK